MRKPFPYHADQSKKNRIVILRNIVLCLFALVFVRLYYWQVWCADSLRAEAESQYNSIKKTTGSRGRVFTADGYVVAANQQVFTVFVQPKQLTISPKELAEKLAPLFASLEDEEEAQTATPSATPPPFLNTEKTLEESWYDTIVGKLTNTQLRWIALKRKVPKEIKERIEELRIAGIGFDQEETRYYPEASMAAHILGFVGNDERGQAQGYFGIEGLYDRELKGKKGLIKQEKDAAGLPIAIGNYDLINSQDGRDVTLTIRRDLQFMLEQMLKKGMEKYGSKTAEAIIMDPKTGAILAMAAFPSYNPSTFYRFEPQLYKNPLIADTYEPGSTMKILTVSSGIDAGVITPDTVCTSCAGPRLISGYTIKTWDNNYYANTTMTEALVHSDNTAMIFAQEKLGKERFVEYLKKFGLGKKTGVDLQEEVLPPFRSDWKDIDAATASFGQGIAVTGMQMIQIAQVIANHGVMMRPMIVQSVKQGAESIVVQPKEMGRVISAPAAQAATTMMEASALHGDAKWAIPKGYRIAGKTGTAQIAVSGHYDEEKTIASFVGFAPAEDPRFVMLVKLREPQTSQWGSETAAPLWFAIARELFVRMNVMPTK